MILKPIALVSNNACSMSVIVGTQKEEEDTDKSSTSLFVFHFRSFPALDEYWTRFRPTLSYLSMSPMDTRISALLSQRFITVVSSTSIP